MFKMAPNSLFAILLRSPWWISLGLALAFGLISKAALPAEYWVFGAMGGFPFLAVGLVALFRQWHQPSPQQAQAILQGLALLTWKDFSTALAQVFAAEGYAVERLEGPADLLIRRAGRSTLVCAKRWKASTTGEEALTALHAAMRSREASGCMFITLGTLSDKAQQFAKQNAVELVQGVALAQLMRDLKVTRVNA